MTSGTALDGFLEPLSQCLDAESARRLMNLRVPPPVQQKMDELADRANEGLLDEDERASYDALINAADIVSILKVKAARQLQGMK